MREATRCICLTSTSKRWGFRSGPENETTLLTQYGTIPREIFYTGRSEDAGLLVANGRTGTGLAIISEVPGYMKRTEIGGWDDPDRVRIGVLYDTDLMPFERTLARRRRIHDRQRFADYLSERQRVSGSALAAAVVYVGRADAAGERAGTTVDLQHMGTVRAGYQSRHGAELLDAASAMGMDIFTIDDGWQQEYGENAVNLTSFPGGLKSILDAVEAKGMRLGLWIPVAAIGRSTAEYRQHPEWASTDRRRKCQDDLDDGQATKL